MSPPEGGFNADHAGRRREMKRRFLEAVAITASEGWAWGVVAEDQEELGLSDDTAQAVVHEVAGEIQRRADRLYNSPEKAPMGDNVYPYEGGRCPHGSAAICPHCEPRRFKIAYVQTQALLAHGEHYTEEEATRVVDEAEADR